MGQKLVAEKYIFEQFSRSYQSYVYLTKYAVSQNKKGTQLSSVGPGSLFVRCNTHTTNTTCDICVCVCLLSPEWWIVRTCNHTSLYFVGTHTCGSTKTGCEQTITPSLWFSIRSHFGICVMCVCTCYRPSLSLSLCGRAVQPILASRGLKIIMSKKAQISVRLTKIGGITRVFPRARETHTHTKNHIFSNKNTMLCFI